MNHPACCFTALVLLAVASAAIGQESAPPAGVAPRVQVGLGGGAHMLLIFPAAGAITTRASVAITPNWGVEGLVDLAPGVCSDCVAGLYRVQARRRLSRASSTQGQRETFLTLGVAGAFRYRRTGQARPRRPSTEVVPPYIPTVGFGVQKVLTSHLALRGDVTVVGFVVVQPTIGVSIPIGHYSGAGG